MSAIIDLRYLAETQPSLCIPRVFNNISETRVRQVFDDLDLGKISRIDIKERKNEKGESFKRVYVHFDKWFWNEDAQAARRKLVSGKEIKIVYDNPWFWKVSASKWTSTSDLVQQERDAPQRKKAHIDFEEENRVTDEFGRDLKLKKDYDERYSPKDTRRPKDTRSPKDTRRPKHNDERFPIAPTLVRKSQLTIAPTLVCNPIEQIIVETKVEPIIVEPKAKTPVVTTPKQCEDKAVNVRSDEGFDIDYGNVQLPKKKLKQAPKKLVEVKEEKFSFTLSEEDKKACLELYGDL